MSEEAAEVGVGTCTCYAHHDRSCGIYTPSRITGALEKTMSVRS